MIYIRNLTGHNLKLTDGGLTNEFGWLMNGDSYIAMPGDVGQVIQWTNGAGSKVLDHSETLARVVAGPVPGATVQVEMSWLYIVPLVVWALWLISKMILRMFARAFGADNVNVLE